MGFVEVYLKFEIFERSFTMSDEWNGTVNR